MIILFQQEEKLAGFRIAQKKVKVVLQTSLLMSENSAEILPVPSGTGINLQTQAEIRPERNLLLDVIINFLNYDINNLIVIFHQEET